MRTLRTAVIVALAVALALGASPASAADGAWDEPPATIADSSEGPGLPKLVTVGSRVLAAWLVDDGFSSAFSDDAGLTWSTPQHTAEGTLTGAEALDLVVVGSTVTALWTAYDLDSGLYVLLAASSSDGGETWSSAHPVVSDADSLDQLQAAGHGGLTVAVWRQFFTAHTEARFAAKSAGGASWSVPLDLSGPGNFSDVAAAVDGSRIGVVWQSYGADGVRFRSSTDGGASWAPALTDPGTPVSGASADGSFPLQIVMREGTITVAWTAGTDPDAYAWTAASSDGGATWSVPVQHSSTGGDSRELHLIDTGYGVALLWTDGSAPLFSGGVIRFSASSDGLAWSAPVDLSAPASNGGQLVALGDALIAAWVTQDPTLPSFQRWGPVTVRISTDRGATWGEPLKLGIESWRQFTPGLAAQGSTVTVAALERVVPGSLLAASYTFPEPPAPEPEPAGAGARARR